jgi:hypothetical protein
MTTCGAQLTTTTSHCSAQARTVHRHSGRHSISLATSTELTLLLASPDSTQGWCRRTRSLLRSLTAALKWSLWDAILTRAGLRPLGYSPRLAHTLAQMACSSHPNIVTKIWGNRASKHMEWDSLGGGHYIHKTDLAPVMVHLAELVLQVNIYVCSPNGAGLWSPEELTWADPSNLTQSTCCPQLTRSLPTQLICPQCSPTHSDTTRLQDGTRKEETHNSLLCQIY